MKTCKSCLQPKSLECFPARSHAKDGHHSLCSICTKAKRKAVYAADQYAAKERARQWREANPDRVAENAAAHRVRTREHRRKAQLEYQNMNRETYNAYQLNYRLTRYKTDPLYALQMTCRRRILCAMQKGGYKKSTKTEALLGCSFEQFKSFLEAKFLPGMTWGNRGINGWHIDHIIPLSSASDRDEMERLCHFTNMQPLWAGDNYAKGAKMPHELGELRTWPIGSRTN